VSGDFAAGPAAGTIICQGKCDFLGVLHMYNVILYNHHDAFQNYIGRGANFNSDVTANKSYIINSLVLKQYSFVDLPPYYNTGSYLVYNTHSQYWRWKEWTSRTGAGYPYNIHIVNTLFDLDHPTEKAADTMQCAGNVVIDSAGALRMDAVPMAKPLYILGNVKIKGSFSLSTIAGGDLIINGDFINDSVFVHNSRLATFRGSLLQNIDGKKASTFAYLSLSNPSGILLGNDIYIVNNLYIGQGIMTTNSNVVTLYANATMNRGSGYVYGFLRKFYNTGAQTFTYMLGTPNGYSPVQLSFTNVSTTGSVTGKAFQSAQPDVPDANYALGRYWKMTAGDGLTFDNYDALFTYLAADFGGIFTESYYESLMSWGKYNTGWTYPTVSSRNTGGSSDGGSITIQGVTSFSDFTGFINSNITLQPSDVTKCAGESAAFSVGTDGVSPTYKWQVNDGSWNNITDVGVYSNAATSTLNISDVTGMNSLMYRCIITSAGIDLTSDSATLTVIQLPTASITPEGTTTFCIGSSVVLNANTGTGFSYVWTHSGLDINGATTSSYIASDSQSCNNNCKYRTGDT
jgi:hypothetical protein